MNKKSIFKIMLFFTVMLLATNVILFTNPAVKNDSYGLSLFFSTDNPNRNVIFIIIFSLIFPIVLLINYFDYDNNRFSNMIITRIRFSITAVTAKEVSVKLPNSLSL